MKLINSEAFLVIIFLSVNLIGCGDSIGKSDLADCWSYEFIAGDIASNQGRQRESIMHYNAKNAFQKLAENKGLDISEFKNIAEKQLTYAKEGNADEIKKIGTKCKNIIDNNADWKAEYKKQTEALQSISK